MKIRNCFLVAAALSTLLLNSGAIAQQTDAPKASLPKSVADSVEWRSIGPANMGGRITAITVYEKDPNIWWAATASGGLLKTENNGNDFEHQFDDQATVSIGDVQVAQSDPNIVWVGTGESNPRNSVSWGDGVYKSTDGGKTWKNMGLNKTFQTGAIAIHPTNPDIVFVGSLGRLWGPNPERGLFKTSDGGKTWKKVLFVDDQTGVVDVQLNPKNPDELLVATYERKRDGFDGNDPVQRFGEGSGIYKSTNGGKTFKRVSKGLPSVKLGRIGLDYFESDPNFVFAVVESEKIGSEPPEFPYLGVTGTDGQEVGSKVSRITEGLAADKAGLKVGDIVVSVNDRIVASHSDMLEEVYRNVAGDTVKLVVVRDKKTINLEMKLGKKPADSRRTGRYFTGTLGGQGANKQDLQGKDGYQYGGVYMSEDGGSSWTRINSLNPRPMYYSNIQVDPLDRNNIYLCGTSLYKSSDGGKTFTGDGGSDGIHVDHHALWIDKRDPRHMILGNDGGVHVTYDRMKHWDHHNHVAIGQFYHVGVDTNDNYKVYGGLQDNGSWGGPSRNNLEGMINSDWFRVGGGDGFVTLADPEDPEQIYYESQNGGMGRIHLGTGARGFIRKPRGMRFNWKTPFILSPHNSKIHYSVGNYVLRSLYKGDKAAKISPSLPNTSRGAGSAVAESPVQAGVIYAGTTDGAVWMTKDGGNNWEPLFFSPAKPKSNEKSAADTKDDKSASAAKAAGKAADKAADKPTEKVKKPATRKKRSNTKKKDTRKRVDSKPKSDSKKSDSKKDDKKSATQEDLVSGVWKARMLTDRLPEDRASFTMALKQSGNKVTGTVSGRSGDQEIENGKFDAKKKVVKFQISGGRAAREFSFTVDGEKLKGQMSIAGGRIRIDIEGKRDDRPPIPRSAVTPGATNDSTVGILPLWSSSASMISMLTAKSDDPISGVWKGILVNENLPNGELEFSVHMKLDSKSRITGYIESPQGEITITEGVFNPKRQRVIINAEGENVVVEMTGTVKGNRIEGELYVNDGMIEADFSITKEPAKDKPAGDKAKAEKPKSDKKGKATQDGKQPASKTKSDKNRKPTKPKQDKQDKPNQDKSKQGKSDKASDDKEVTAKKGDLVTGTWTGKMTAGNSDRDLKIVLIRKSDSSITGTFETGQGEREITSGSYSPKTKRLSLVSESDQRSLEFDGKLEGDQFDGELSAGRRFTMEFSLKRTSKTAKRASQEEAKEEQPMAKQGPTGPGSLASMMPGPRWVSSLEASRFKAGRCYITMDGHRSNDDGIYAFVTEDFGKTWKSLTDNLPKTCGSVRVLREDVVNENLLFLGCEFSAWWSIDRGQTWTRISGLPTVAVHEFAIHPTAGEVVAGTHGRSLWIADISVLRQLSKDRLKQDLYLYRPQPVVRGSRTPGRGNSGTRRFVGQNPKSSVTLGYSLGKNARRASLRILDRNDEVIQEFEDVSRRAGFHSVEWDIRRAGLGTYQVELKVDGQVRTQFVEIKADPNLSSRARAVLSQEDALTEFDEFLEHLLNEKD